VTIEKAPEHGRREMLVAIGDQAFLYFQQRHVRLSANEAEQIIAMGLNATGTAIPPSALNRATQRTALAMLTPSAWPPRCATCRPPPPPPQRIHEDRRKAPSSPPPSRGDDHQAKQSRFGNP
jgi:hypothetical protein